MSINDVTIPGIFILAGLGFLAVAFGIQLVWIRGNPPSIGTRVAAGLLGLGLMSIGTLIYFSPEGLFAPRPSGEPTPLTTFATTPSPSSAAPILGQPSVGPDCGIVTVRADLFTKDGPALPVGATVTITGPDVYQGDERSMWMFSHDGPDWFPLTEKIERTGGKFQTQDVPLGRTDHPEDASDRIRYIHVVLFSPSTNEALHRDLDSKYHPFKSLPGGAFELFVIPLHRVCTPK